MPAIAFLLANWRWISAVVALLALFGGGGAYVAKVKHDAYQQGYSVGYATARGEYEKKMRDMEIANQNAIHKSAELLADLEKKLSLKDIQLDDYLKGIDLAADQAPDGGDACLDVDSVRRLGAIE